MADQIQETSQNYQTAIKLASILVAVLSSAIILFSFYTIYLIFSGPDDGFAGFALIIWLPILIIGFLLLILSLYSYLKANENHPIISGVLWASLAVLLFILLLYFGSFLMRF